MWRTFSFIFEWQWCWNFDLWSLFVLHSSSHPPNQSWFGWEYTPNGLKIWIFHQKWPLSSAMGSKGLFKIESLYSKTLKHYDEIYSVVYVCTTSLAFVTINHILKRCCKLLIFCHYGKLRFLRWCWRTELWMF